MIHYLVHKPDGSILQRGHCPDEESLPEIPDHVIEIIEEDDTRGPKVVTRDGYEDFRRMEYPTFGDQLDAMWKALEAMGALEKAPEAKAMFEKIKAVKNRRPKPQGNPKN